MQSKCGSKHVNACHSSLWLSVLLSIFFFGEPLQWNVQSLLGKIREHVTIHLEVQFHYGTLGQLVPLQMAFSHNCNLGNFPGKEQINFFGAELSVTSDRKLS